MIKRTLYFGNPAYLSLKDKQMVIELPIEKTAHELQKTAVPIEDIGIVMLDTARLTITQPLLNALLDNNVALVTCNEKHMPAGLFLPLEGNTLQTERFKNQIEASLPLKKQLWQQTVQKKIENQAWLLKKQGVNTEPMEYWQKSTRSGDPDNFEARAAAYYWKHFFTNHGCEDFTRGRFEGGLNVFLNYGYAVLRAVVARSLVGSGLLSTLGIHHHNKYNAYCLADDIMEPFRPFVDRLVYDIAGEKPLQRELTKDVKARLLSIPALDVIIDGKRSPLMVASNRTTASLNDCFEGSGRKILYPSFESY